MTFTLNSMSSLCSCFSYRSASSELLFRLWLLHFSLSHHSVSLAELHFWAVIKENTVKERAKDLVECKCISILFFFFLHSCSRIQKKTSDWKWNAFATLQMILYSDTRTKGIQWDTELHSNKCIHLQLNCRYCVTGPLTYVH